MFCVLSFISLCIICILTETQSFGKRQQSWEYTPISLEANSTNEDVVKLDMRVERIGRGKYALSGTIKINFDHSETDYIEVFVYRSATGGKEYKPTPMQIPKMNMQEYLRTTYKNLIMKNLVDCSDFPQAEDDDIPVVERKTYTFTKCVISTEGYPSYLMPGFYKIVIVATSEAFVAVIEFIMDVRAKEL